MDLIVKIQLRLSICLIVGWITRLGLEPRTTSVLREYDNHLQHPASGLVDYLEHKYVENCHACNPQGLPLCRAAD